MEISIDIDNETPLFNQLIEQIKKAVSSGEITTDFCLPSIRQLANDLGINANTVAKAYKLLERDSVIITRGYRGTFVHPQAIKNCQIDLNQQAHLQFNEVIKSLRITGLTDSEIRIAFNNTMKKK
ncbi:MAG: GntR family transcriptional regulator [Alcanivoracaceae bacterium]|nr:GntR family transcriptional regulator [Alcanivoracaceae bacterium]